MESARTVLFLCPHGSAKSVIAAAYCERSARQRGLDLLVLSAGTEPAAVVPRLVVEALGAEDIDVSAYRPRRVTPEELTSAWRVISLGCDLNDLGPPGPAVESWDEVPAASDGVGATCAAIAVRVALLLDDLEGSDAPPARKEV